MGYDRLRIFQVVLHSREIDLLTQLHYGLQKVIWMFATPWINSGNSCNGSRQEQILRNDVYDATFVQPVAISEPGLGTSELAKGRSPFGSLAIDVTDSFARSDYGNLYLLIAVDYFAKRPEPFATSTRRNTTLQSQSEYVVERGHTLRTLRARPWLACVRKRTPTTMQPAA